MSNNLDFSFLSNVEVKAIEVKKPSAKKASAPKIPDSADIRVFANGKVYPSEEFATKNNLEYGPRIEKDGKSIVANNGIDIFPSTEWGMITKPLPQDLLFACIVPKAEPKVDLWSSTTYNEDGSPKASVMTQGSTSFSKGRLLEIIAAVYGVDWDKVEYVDMKMFIDSPVVSPTGVYHLPKIVSSGARKGEPTYERRDNILVCPLAIVHTEYKEEQEQDNVPETPQAETVASELVNEKAKFEDVPEEQKAAEVEATDTTTDNEDWAAGLGDPNFSN